MSSEDYAVGNAPKKTIVLKRITSHKKESGEQNRDKNKRGEYQSDGFYLLRISQSSIVND